MSIKDRAREFFDANPELFVVVELDGGRTESELDFHTRIATSFATVEREAAVREFIEKALDPSDDIGCWTAMRETFHEMFGKELDRKEII